MSLIERPPPGVHEEISSKNRLQQYTQRASLPLPIYYTESEGSPHAPSFRSRVSVDGTCFSSQNSFSTRKMAEQDAAKLALIGIQDKVKNEGSLLVLQDTIFCKSIIYEYAVKVNLSPNYVTNQSAATLPLFVSSLILNGVTYVGEARQNKREAEQFAARSAILSILGSDSSLTMSEIVRSKFRFYDALKKAKELSVMSTETNSLKDINDSSEVLGINIPSDVSAMEAPFSVNKRKEDNDSGDHVTGVSTAVTHPSVIKIPLLHTTQMKPPEFTLDQPSNTRVASQSLHESKKPKLTASLTEDPRNETLQAISGQEIPKSSPSIIPHLLGPRAELPESTLGQTFSNQVMGQSIHELRKPPLTSSTATSLPNEFLHPPSKEALRCSVSTPQPSLLITLPTTEVELPKSTSEHPSNTRVVGQFVHEFTNKNTKLTTSSATIAPLIEFVPPASGQATTGSTKRKKRRRNKKVKKEMVHQSVSPNVVVPQSSYSVAQ